MLSKKIKDIKNRQKVYKEETLKIQAKFLFRYLLNNPLLKKNHKLYSMIIFSFLKSSLVKSSKTTVTRRCVLNNRSRTATRKFGISRIIFRELLQFGVIPGFVKAVW